MKLEGIIPLYRSMKQQGIERYKFEFSLNQGVFDVFFFIDSSNFLLLFGAKGENFSFEIPMERGFQISTHLDTPVYRELCRVLGLKYDPENPFSPSKFFVDFNRRIPDKAYLRQKAEPHEVAQYSNDIEEAHKKYFLGWRDNTSRGDDVTESNLFKTKELLGEAAYLRCRERNISSCWTDKKEKAKKFYMP
ncbi:MULTISPECIES: DUF6037 family protein [Vibrio]|uniref:DUF6037 family protein n=1 Tax=Vibrio TaxID=662 RepID=UPI0006E6D184|nr:MULTISPECIES: DUF6037 family protein [Vibrio]EGR1130025.1 rloe protein [Vibrio cholerae]EJL6307534.1 hypothetical protein [Vibrio cholerae]EJL6615583.1 hypothetical protein [Vibrio cholerae]EJL6677192.1 hypothetical protein [Vibrio cholerae]EJL6759278.1 hypothetical protein [Vibrio cholerae]